jgi:amidase
VDALVFSPDLGSPMTMIAAMGYAAVSLSCSTKEGHKLNHQGIAPMGYCENGAPFGILFVVKSNEEEKLLTIL